MVQKYSILCLFALLPYYAHAQFPPQPGLAGSDAIIGTSPLFVGWAIQCKLQLGYMDIANPSLGIVSAGDSSMAIGSADGYVVSLGDSGIAILTFAHPIYDGPGPDFAIFENGFRNPADSSQAYLELAFVEVSSDGLNYFRFPATCLNSDIAQIPGSGVYMDATKINNLAGKYIGGYGTPFDLHQLSGKPGLDINSVTHVRVIDVIGSINGHSTYDSSGRIINDPYPTPYPTGGFDLDAVGVINQIGTAVKDIANDFTINIFPNPASNKLNILLSCNNNTEFNATITTILGLVINQVNLKGGMNNISLENYPKDIYIVVITNNAGNKWVEKFIKY